MKISVVGCGYLGAVHAACLVSVGHEVVGLDVDRQRTQILNKGQAPFHEPDLVRHLEEGVHTRRLTFGNDPAAAAGADVHFLCVGTPQRDASGAANLDFLDAAVASLLPHLRPGDVVVGKSTVPVGTAARLEKWITDEVPGVAVAWNPEFLREGHAVKDTLHPDRLVYGLPEDPAAADLARQRLDEVYAQPLAAGTPRLLMDHATAELVKVAANSFLATKISFINAMAEICEATGADVSALADAIGHDVRIGRRFLNAGVGFGGGCLPKDIRAFAARATELGVGQSLGFLREVDGINLRRRTRVVELARELCDGSVDGKVVAVLGAAFKPHSDDIRDSPALDVALALVAAGASVRVTDPAAVENARRLHPGPDYVATAEDAAADADVVLLLTEWPEYRALDPRSFGQIVNRPMIVDGRNVLDPTPWRAAGWTLRSLGGR